MIHFYASFCYRDLQDLFLKLRQQSVKNHNFTSTSCGRTSSISPQSNPTINILYGKQNIACFYSSTPNIKNKMVFYPFNRTPTIHRNIMRRSMIRDMQPSFIVTHTVGNYLEKHKNISSNDPSTPIQLSDDNPCFLNNDRSSAQGCMMASFFLHR